MPQPAFLLAPGAGAPSSHPWMQHWRDLLGQLGLVRTLDYPYMIAHARRPDPLPKLIAAHRAALEELRQQTNAPIVLVGKSMGGRIGCHLSLQEKVAAVICFGYPLCGGGDPTRLRDKVLREMTAPILFIQGTRDALCPLPLLEEVRRDMRATNELHIVEGGDHSLAITKRQLTAAQETQTEVDQRILQNLQTFLIHHQLA